eukprot:s3547_g3.t1
MAVRCSLQVSDYLARRWDEVNSESQDSQDRISIPPKMVGEDLLLEEQDFGLMYKRIKLLSQAGSALKRSQKSLGDYWDHRRRFIRCLAKPGSGGASEADLRLLFLPFRDVKGTELAAHVRRLSGAVEDLVVESRKRSSVVNLEAVRRNTNWPYWKHFQKNNSRSMAPEPEEEAMPGRVEGNQ